MFQKYIDLYQFTKNPAKFCKKENDFVFELNGKSIYCTQDKELIEKVGGAKSDLFDREVIGEILGSNILTETQSKVDSLKLKRIFVRTLQQLHLSNRLTLCNNCNGKEIINKILFELIGGSFSYYSPNFSFFYQNWIESINSELLFVPFFRRRIFSSWRKFQKTNHEIEISIKHLIDFPNTFPNLFKKIALEEGIYLSEREIIDNSLLFLFGAFDNISILISNVFIRFSSEFRPDRLNDFLNDLDYHIEDSLRSKPPIPFIPKTLQETLTHKGKVFFAGETIGIIPTATNGKMFGVGKRKCPGEEFAYKIARLALSRILPKYQLDGKVKYSRQRFSYGPSEFGVKEI